MYPIKLLLIAITLIISSHSFAQDIGVAPSGTAGPKLSELSLGTGLIASTSSQYAVKQGSTTLVNASYHDRSSPQFSAELGKFVSERFQLSARIFWNRYSYKEGEPSDTELGLILSPKFYANFDHFRIWAGFGVGFVNTSFGNTTGNESGITINLDSGSNMAFAFSPSIGFDYHIGESNFIGIQTNYVSFNGEIDITLISGSSTAKLKEDYTRSWVCAMLYYGFRFN